MIDEVRHVNQEAHLVRYLAKHSVDAEGFERGFKPVSYTHLRAHETVLDLVCRLLLEKNNNERIHIPS